MGIGLINIGSVGFENVACIFDESRLQRKCSIVTDLDVVVDGAKSQARLQWIEVPLEEKVVPAL